MGDGNDGRDSRAADLDADAIDLVEIMTGERRAPTRGKG